MLVYSIWHMKKYVWWFSIVAVFSILACSVLWFSLKEEQQHIVLRLPTGFFPNIVYIKKNESVRFINMTSVSFWPASGPHPTHTSYPEFDVKKEIAPLHSWVFTFDKSGTFTFHDHLAPEFTGIVISGPNDISRVDDQNTCTVLSEQEQAGCIEIYFKNITDKKPFAQTLEIFTDISTRYPGSCHTFAHDLGKNAYIAYLEHTLPDNIGPEGSFCGYGFWHGFTTAMQAHSGLSATKEFCASLGGATNVQLRTNRMNCYHGIGIGLIPDPPPVNLWGVFQPLVDPALAFCDTIPEESSYRERCLTGVFHAMTVYMAQKIYGFVYDENSLAICSKQAVAYQKTCFNTLVAQLPEFTNFNLEQTVTILQKTVPPLQFLEIFGYAAVIFVNAEASIAEIGHFIEKCDTLSNDFRPICISAVINKLYNNGVPGIEYQKAVAFCSSSWMRDTEQTACFQEVISYSVRVYTSEKMAEVCNALPGIQRMHVVGC